MQFFDEIRLGESQTQVDAQYVNLRWLQRTMGSSSVFPSPKPYPEACEGAATFVINQGLQKTCATPISGDLGGYGSVYNALNLNGVGSTVTATVDVAWCALLLPVLCARALATSSLHPHYVLRHFCFAVQPRHCGL